MRSQNYAWILAAAILGCAPPEMAEVSAPGTGSPQPATPEGQEAEVLGEPGARVGSSVREKSREARAPRVP